MQLGKTCLLSSQSQWWIAFTDWIGRVGSRSGAWQVRWSWFINVFITGGFACKWSSEVTLSVAAFMRAKCKKKKNEGIKYLSRWNEFCFRQQMTCGSCSGLRVDSSASQERLQKIPSASCGRGSVCEESKHTVGGGRVYLFKSRGFHHLLSQLSCDWWAITSFKLLCQMYF